MVSVFAKGLLDTLVDSGELEGRLILTDKEKSLILWYNLEGFEPCLEDVRIEATRILEKQNGLK